jgi:hypothetical protein
MKKAVVFASLLAAQAQTPVESIRVTEDSRLSRLEKFFEKCSSPLREFARDFLAAADKNRLDWRLLPSISMVESQGGKSYRNNNVLGWNCSRTHFPSVREGIHAVAARLSHSPLYRNKDTDGILHRYNTSPSYVVRVKAIMHALEATDLLQPAVATY